MRVGVYPGTFDPPTVAHLAIAEAAWRQGRLDRLDLAVSRLPLGKSPAAPSFEHRLEVIEAVAASRAWMAVVVTEARLLVDIAAGYDAVVMGLDKWAQVCDPAWYGGSEAARDAVLGALPEVLLAHRAGDRRDHPEPRVGRHLEVPVAHLEVSSSAARQGRTDWMAPEAVAFDRRTGAWSNPGRYMP